MIIDVEKSKKMETLGVMFLLTILITATNIVRISTRNIPNRGKFENFRYFNNVETLNIDITKQLIAQLMSGRHVMNQWLILKSRVTL